MLDAWFLELCVLCVLSRLFFSIFRPPSVTLAFTKRLRLILILLAVIFAGGITLLFFSSPTEPTYKGRKLSEWMYTITVTKSPYARVIITITDYADAQSAVRAVGTNGLPTIRRMLHAHDGAIRRGLIKFVNGRDFFRMHLHTDEEKVVAALRAIEILGLRAQTLLPDLIRLAQNPDVKFRTHGMRGILGLLHEFGGISPRDPALVSLLLDRINDPDPVVKFMGWTALRDLRASDRKIVLDAYQAGVVSLSTDVTNTPTPPK